MKRILTIAVLLASLAVGRQALCAEQTKPNVLMIAVDDLSDYVSILQNHPGIKTPNFDRLAKRSVNFTRAYCAAPLCQPSRAAVITGMAPHQTSPERSKRVLPSEAAVITGMAPHQTGIYDLGHSMVNSVHAMQAIGLEEQFKRHGYDTYQTGKFYHSEPTKRAWPKDRMQAAWTEMKGPFSNHGPILAKGNKVMGGGVSAIGPAPNGLGSMPDVACLKNTQGWLAQGHDRPFLIVHGINKPHVAFVVPQEFYDLYPLDSIFVPETVRDDFSDIPPSVITEFLGKGDLEGFAKVRKAENGWQEVMQAYMASISFCDWVLGQLLDSLDASPYADNTIIVLWSDHGYHIGEKERLHKRALWTQTSRVPFLISVPSMATAGDSCAAPVSLLDIYPTLNELCGLGQKVPQALAGHSLAPLLKAPASDWPFVAVTSHNIGNAAVTDARYHYIRYANGSEELYDHQTDPREYHNLVKELGLKPIKEKLAASVPRDWVPHPGRKVSGASD